MTFTYDTNINMINETTPFVNWTQPDYANVDFICRDEYCGQHEQNTNMDIIRTS